MKKFLLPLMLLCLITAHAQTNERIGYYYKGIKVYYPVSYDRIVAEAAPGVSFSELKRLIATQLAIAGDSIQETLTGRQFVIKFGDNKAKGSASVVAKLGNIPGILFSHPTFKTPSGNYNSYGKEFIVKLKSTTQYATVQKLMEKNGCTLIRKYPFQDDMYIIAAGAKAGYNGLAMANLFYETGLFDYAEPNKIVYNALHVSPPNDPLYNLQWAHHNTGSAAQYSGTPGMDMKILQAWGITMGQPFIKIGVIDDGVDLTHPDLQANLLQGFNGGTMTSNPGDGAPSVPSHAHGTNCAGIIAAIANNNTGVAGIAPNCKIIPAVIFGGTSTSATYLGDDAVAACFDYVRLAGADVISNSWGGGGLSSAIDAAISRAVTLGRHGKGCVVLFSSGNGNNGAVSYPARNSQVISVGGISMCGERKNGTSCDGETSWGANYGAGLDVVAPCVKIATTDIQGTGGYNNTSGAAGDYNNIFNGTSSSCPNAAGVAALILSVDSNLTLSDATQILELSCDKLPAYTYAPNADPNQPNGTWNNETGHGKVNAFSAVQLASTGNFCAAQISAPTTQICNNGISMSVNNPDLAYTYQWRRNGQPLATGNMYTAATPGTYDVLATKGGCTVTSNEIALTNTFTVSMLAAPDTICKGEGSTLTTIDVSQVAAYCSPAYSNGTAFGDYISLVSIGGTTLSNTSAGAANPFYTLYPQTGSTTGTLSGGTNYTLSVKGGTFTLCYIRAWIDYNQDGIFDTNTESLGISGNVGSKTLGTVDFTVPAGAINGTTRLRLRSSDTGPTGFNASSSCGAANSGYGEAEDYFITITNGVPIFTYNWTENPIGTTLVTNNNAQVIAANITQRTTYKVTVTNANGCVASDSAVVNIRFINSTFSKVDAGCFGSATGSLTVTPTNGTGPYTYRIGTIGSFISSNTFSGLKAGNYRVSIRDANGCAGISSQITISQQPAITAQYGITALTCSGAGNGAILVTPNNGTGPYAYRLGTSGAYSSNNNLTGLNAGSYRVYIQDANSCTSNASVAITEPLTLGQLFSIIKPLCFGAANGTVTVNGTGGTAPFQYRLGTTGAFSSNNTFTGLRAASYRIYIQDSKGCAFNSTAVVAQPMAFSFNFSKTDLTCFRANNGSITLTGLNGTPPYSFRLGTVGGYSANNTFANLRPGNYRAYAQDANSCAGGSVTINIAQSLDTCNPAGITNISKSGSINSYKNLEAILSPNPSNSQFLLQVHAPKQDLVSIKISDVNGKVVYQTKGVPEQIIRFGNTLMTGVYMIEVRQGNEVKMIKGVKIK